MTRRSSESASAAEALMNNADRIPSLSVEPDDTMLKITVSNQNSGVSFILSGRLAGLWVQELCRCWTTAEIDDPTQCQVDLREVTFIDEAGKTLLSQMNRKGVRILAAGCLTKAIVQDLRNDAVPLSCRLRLLI